MARQCELARLVGLLRHGAARPVVWPCSCEVPQEAVFELEAGATESLECASSFAICTTQQSYWLTVNAVAR